MDASNDPVTQTPLTLFVRQLQRHQAACNALKQLQNNHSRLQQNVLCYALWFAETKHGRLRRAHFQTLNAALHPWHDCVLQALQQLQQQLSGKGASRVTRIRAWIMDEVTYAQETEQAFLYQSLIHSALYHRSASQCLLDACYNVAHYFRYEKVSMTADDMEWLVVLMQLVFPNNATAMIRQTILDAAARARLDQSQHEQLKLV